MYQERSHSFLTILDTKDMYQEISYPILTILDTKDMYQEKKSSYLNDIRH